jgi:hypothetical protein
MSRKPGFDPLELSRRTKVTKGSLVSTPLSADAVVPKLEFNDLSQKFAVVNLANVNLVPQSINPAVRVLGLFPSVQTAAAFGKSMASSIPGCNIYIVETCKWNLIPKSKDKTPEQCLEKVNDMLLTHYKNIVMSKIEFDRRRNSKTDKEIMDESVFNNPSHSIAMQELTNRGVTVESLEPELQSRAEDVKRGLLERVQAGKEKERNESPEVKIEDVSEHNKEQEPEQKVSIEQKGALSVEAESKDGQLSTSLNSLLLTVDNDFTEPLWNQKFITIAFILDEQEPAYCIFSATETLQESKGFDFNVLRIRVPDHDVTFAEAGKWLYPEATLQLEKLGLVSHRLDEQNRIMDHNRQSQNLSYSSQEGLTIEADMVLDEHGNIVPLIKEQKD